MVRAIRGAITVDANTADDIVDGTRELLEHIVLNNHLTTDNIISAIFTVTPDLNAQYPAAAAREMGWHDIPLLCACEINKPEGLPKCIRVLLHVHSDKPKAEIRHVYLRKAVSLRPDIAMKGE